MYRMIDQSGGGAEVLDAGIKLLRTCMKCDEPEEPISEEALLNCLDVPDATDRATSPFIYNQNGTRTTTPSPKTSNNEKTKKRKFSRGE